MRGIMVLGLLTAAIASPGFAAEMKGIRLGDEYLRIPFATHSEGKTYGHLNVDKGTVEFWVKPDLWYEHERRGLFYCGGRSNGNCISFSKRSGLNFHLGATNNKALISTVGTSGMKPASWHHIAYCWDVEGGKESQTVFLDGKKAKVQESMWSPERKFVGLSKKQSYIYIGTHSTSTSRKNPKLSTAPPNMTITQFRISDIVRYETEFAPATGHSVDTHTRLYFPFTDNEKGMYHRGEGKEPGTVEAERIKTAEAAAKPGKRIPAFPGAEGFGAFTLGGRGGRIIEVINLNGDGPGSLQWACSQKGPRIVVFRVSGIIPGPVSLRNPFITIAGQTAPGDGICIRGCFNLGADNAIIRYLRMRPGDHPLGTNPEERDCFSVRANNVIIDHCSASWGIDENVQVYGPYDKVTVQWCITSESLWDSIHPKGPHGMGMILGCASMAGVSVHNCLLAHNYGRNPLIAARNKGAPIYDIRNNVCYARHPAVVQILGHPRVNLIGHTIKRGVPGPHKTWVRWFGISADNPYRKHGPAQVYVKDNVWPANPTGAGDPWAIVSKPGRPPTKGFKRLAEPVPAPAVTTQPRAEAYESVLKYAGCILPVRDVVDDRIVAEVRAGTGGIIDSQEYVGGWPTYASAKPPADSDHDAMPDAWEKRHGFNPNDPTDGPKDRDGDGYTNVEEFLNRTDPAAPDTGEPIAHSPVKVQAGNDRIRGKAARELGEKLFAAQQTPNCTPASAEALLKRVQASGKDVADLLGIKMARIEPGEFELMKIRFRITRAYQIGATEVTQGQWQAVMGTRPWAGRPGVKDGPDYPASYVSYIDVQEFIRRLNACGGPKWRLPTGAEWRLAARGGTKYKFGFPGGYKLAPEYAFCCYRVWQGKRMTRKRFPTTPEAAARLVPNPFGLYNMAGNVREWVSDFADSHYFTDLKKYGADRADPTGPKSSGKRTICGGNFRYVTPQLFYERPSAGHKPHYRGFGVGFRLARSVP